MPVILQNAYNFQAFYRMPKVRDCLEADYINCSEADYINNHILNVLKYIF